MVFRGAFGTALMCQSLLLCNWVGAELQQRLFDDVFREAKMKIGNGTLRTISQPSGPEANPSTFRFYKQETSGEFWSSCHVSTPLTRNRFPSNELARCSFFCGRDVFRSYAYQSGKYIKAAFLHLSTNNRPTSRYFDYLA